jgi:hypothetical protein
MYWLCGLKWLECGKRKENNDLMFCIGPVNVLFAFLKDTAVFNLYMYNFYIKSAKLKK